MNYCSRLLCRQTNEANYCLINIQEKSIPIMIQESNADVRITVIVNPSTDTNDVDSTADINQIALAALNSLPVEKAMRFIRNIVKEDVANVIISGKQFDIEVIMFD